MVEKSHTAGWWPQVYEPLRQFGEKVADWFAPRSEASTNENSYEICVELPGVKADDIEISAHDNQLTVKGEKKLQREEQGRSYFFSEREYGAFLRTFRLPTDADADGITADFSDGVLKLSIPKAGPPKEKTRQIKVRTG